MRILRKTLFLSTLLIAASGYSFVSPSSAYAGGYLIPGTPLAAGGQAEDILLVPLNAQFEAGRSYACTLVGSDQDTNLIVTASGGGGDAVFTNCGATTPIILVGSKDTSNANNRVCIVPDTTATYSFLLASGKSGGEKARFECLETTLYGGYNTNANDFNFLEISNLTNTQLSVTVHAVNFDGTKVIDGQSLTIAANVRADVDLHSSAGANKFGIVSVTHDGPYGAIQAAVSQYEGPVSSLTLRATVPLKPRDQNL